MTAASPNQTGRSQTGPMFQRGYALPDPLEDETWLCEPVAVREGADPLQTEPARTAILSAARTSDAPRQRLSMVTPAHRSGKTWSATTLLAASAGKSVHRTGDAA